MVILFSKFPIPKIPVFPLGTYLYLLVEILSKTSLLLILPLREVSETRHTGFLVDLMGLQLLDFIACFRLFRFWLPARTSFFIDFL